MIDDSEVNRSTDAVLLKVWPFAKTSLWDNPSLPLDQFAHGFEECRGFALGAGADSKRSRDANISDEHSAIK